MTTNRLLWPELEPAAVQEGWLADVPLLTAGEVLDAVGRRHPMDGFNGQPGRWVFVREVQAETGAYSSVQRFDAVAIGLVPSTKYSRVVYEVKVTRSDWLRELRPVVRASDGHGYVSRQLAGRVAKMAAEGHLPTWVVEERRKWEAALEVSTEFWYAAPPRCILAEELPPEAGLLEIRAWGAERELRARIVRKAPVRDTPLPGAGFWSAVLRRAAAIPRETTSAP